MTGLNAWIRSQKPYPLHYAAPQYSAKSQYLAKKGVLKSHHSNKLWQIPAQVIPDLNLDTSPPQKVKGN
jgi:hypothetical protein